jgi:NitT/TauT family transport system substrate-binding protein
VSQPHRRSRRRLPVAFVAFAALTVLAVVVAGCAGAPGGGSAGASSAGRVTLRLGYLPNLTHAPALVGLEGGTFAAALGPSVDLDPQSFDAGPAETEALLSGSLDIAYVGPNPAINAYQKSGGEAIRVIAGSTSGGAALVVRDGIATAADLRGTTLATPSVGNTQDVALRTWLRTQGFATTTEGGGDVSIAPQANAQTLDTFRAGTIDGAWVPEPWATRLVLEGHGHVLVNEADLWPGGRFVTTQVVVRTQFLADHPDVVRRFVAGHVAAVDLTASDPARARELANAGIAAVTGKPLATATIEAAWAHLSFTVDPEATSLQGAADHARALGLLDAVDLAGIYDLTALNGVLVALGRAKVAGL